MSGSAFIASGNDVLLTSGNTITITGELKTSGIVATITPASYSTTDPVLDGESSLVSSASGMLAVTNDSQGGRWVIGTNGYLKDGPLGSKSQPSAVGDIVFSDGTAEAYTSQLSDKQKNAAVAVIFDATNKKGILLTQATNKAWAVDGASGLNSDSGLGTVFCDNISDGSSNSVPFADDYNYQASQWALNSGGYLPAKNELETLMNNKTTVNSALSKLGATQIDNSAKYWSSTAINTTQAYYISGSSTSCMMGSMTNEYNVCAIKKY